MDRSLLARITLVASLASLAGCDLKTRLLMSPEEKINAAFPVSDAVRNARLALADLPGDAAHRELDAQYDTRLKLRALNCSKGYTPSRFDSLDAVRKRVDNIGCFNEADASTARWLGLRRVAVALAKPPLKALPSTAPAFIVADDAIQSARFADKAGVALIQTSNAIEVLDFESTKPLFREARSATSLGGLSANGRVFAVGDGQHLQIKETENGNTLVELPSVATTNFGWLGDAMAVYAGSPTRKATLIDFASGKEVPIDFVSGNGPIRTGTVPGSANQFILFSGGSITRIEVNHDRADPEVKLIAEKSSPSPVRFYNAEPAADGTHFFSAFRDLTLISMDTLEAETVSFAPFALSSAFPTSDPDRMIIVGNGVTPTNRGLPIFIYSLAARTVTPLDSSGLPSTRFLYIPSLHRHAVINDTKIVVLGELATSGDSLPLEQFRADALQVANQRKLDQFAMQQSASNGYPSMPGATAAMPPYPGSALRTDDRPTYAGAGLDGNLLQAIARNAQIEAVGVYQGGPRNVDASGRPAPGYVEVHVRRSARPVVLVLSSYEPVRWLLISEGGGRVAAVVLSGRSTSQVIGAGGARVVVSGSAFAYKQASPEFNLLNQQTVQLLGRGINVFQGRYDGGPFNVGG